MPLSAAQHAKLQTIVAYLEGNESTDSDSLLSIALEIIAKESPSWLLVMRVRGRTSHVVAGDGFDDRLGAEVQTWVNETFQTLPTFMELAKPLQDQIASLGAELAELRAKVAAVQSIAR